MIPAVLVPHACVGLFLVTARCLRITAHPLRHTITSWVLVGLAVRFALTHPVETSSGRAWVTGFAIFAIVFAVIGTIYKWWRITRPEEPTVIVVPVPGPPEPVAPAYQGGPNGGKW